MEKELFQFVILLLFLLAGFGSFYVSVRSCKWNLSRMTYWTGALGMLVSIKISGLLFKAYFDNSPSPMAALIGLGVQIAATGFFAFYWGRFAAGRALNVGLNRHWAWLLFIPLIGLLALGLPATDAYRKRAGAET